MKALDFLLRHRVTGAPVVDPAGMLLGIITEKDLLKLVTEGVNGEPHSAATVAEFSPSTWVALLFLAMPSNSAVGFTGSRDTRR